MGPLKVGVGRASARPPYYVTKLVTSGNSGSSPGLVGTECHVGGGQLGAAQFMWSSWGWAGHLEAQVPVQGPWLSPTGPGRGVHGLCWTSVSCGKTVCQLCPWAPLWSEVHRLDVAPWEETYVPAEPASPPVGVQVL